MSQAQVHSIAALGEFRAALAVYGEDVLAALGAVDAEIRRTVQWLQQDRPYYWQEQIKRRREHVASARAELFRLKLQKTPEHHPSLAEPKERLRIAEAALQDAEKRLILTRKWQSAFQQAVIEYHGSIQRLKEAAAVDVPRATLLLTRILESLERYLVLQPPDARNVETPRATPPMEAIARDLIERDDESTSVAPEPEEAP